MGFVSRVGYDGDDAPNLDVVVASGTNILVVVVTGSRGADAGISALSRDGQAFSQVGSDVSNGLSPRAHVEIWELINPTVGTFALVPTYVGDGTYLRFTVYELVTGGAAEAVSAGSASSTAGTSVTSSVVTLTAGAIIIDGLTVGRDDTVTSVTASDGQDLVQSSVSDGSTTHATKQVSGYRIGGAAGSHAMGYSWTNNSNRQATLCAAWPDAAAAASPPNPARPQTIAVMRASNY